MTAHRMRLLRLRDATPKLRSYNTARIWVWRQHGTRRLEWQETTSWHRWTRAVLPMHGGLNALLLNMSDERVAGAGGRLVEGVRESLADRWRSARMLREWGTERIENPVFVFGCNNVFSMCLH